MTNLTPVALWRLWLEPKFFVNMMKLIYMIEYSITNRMNQNMAFYHEKLRKKMSHFFPQIFKIEGHILVHSVRN